MNNYSIFMFTVQLLNSNIYSMKRDKDPLFKDEEYLNIIRKISKDSNISQREISTELGISLGKVNYCLRALKEKGFIKIKNFKKSENKMKYFYILTPKGISEKTKITIRFMKQKMREYDELKKEIKKHNKEK